MDGDGYWERLMPAEEPKLGKIRQMTKGAVKVKVIVFHSITQVTRLSQFDAG